MMSQYSWKLPRIQYRYCYTLKLSENLGHEMYLYLNGIGVNTVIARVDGRAGVKEGTNVKLALDMNKIHFFDKETTLSILANP